MIRTFCLLISFAVSVRLVSGQDIMPCQPVFGMQFDALKTMLTSCPGIRRTLNESFARQTVVLLKDGRIVTYSFRSDSLRSIEDLWTFSTRKSAEDLFYSIYDHLLNLDATPIEFVENMNETRIVAETEEKRFSLFMQDLREPHVVVSLVVERAH